MQCCGSQTSPMIQSIVIALGGPQRLKVPIAESIYTSETETREL